MLKKVTQNIPGQPGIKWVKFEEIQQPTAIQLADELINDPITSRLGFVHVAAKELKALYYQNQELTNELKKAKNDNWTT